jgi:hypothetical protein
MSLIRSLDEGFDVRPFGVSSWVSFRLKRRNLPLARTVNVS